MKDQVSDFKVIIPAELSKNAEGDWIVQGLASTPSRDMQGEVIMPSGIDTTPIDEGRGILNWDHQKGPENVVGLLDSYKKTDNGLFIKGRLLKNHTKAKAIHEIMSSLGKSDRGRMGLSVEGKILERGGKDGKVIKKCQINAVALTMNPVNQDSYADLAKSLANTEIDFQATSQNVTTFVTSDTLPIFTANQVLELIEKALGVSGSVANTAPANLSGGDAMTQEALDKKPKELDKPEPKKKLKKLTKDMYKSYIGEILDQIQKLYPENSRTQLWEALKDRLNRRFED